MKPLRQPPNEYFSCSEAILTVFVDRIDDTLELDLENNKGNEHHLRIYNPQIVLRTPEVSIEVKLSKIIEWLTKNIRGFSLLECLEK